jgi:hypothetical protein
MGKMYILILAFLCFSISAQNWKWCYKITQQNGYASVVADSLGNCYVFGQHHPPAFYNAANGVFPVKNHRSAVAKYDAMGNLLWLGGVSGTNTHSTGWTIDANGNTFHNGNFIDTVSFGVGNDTMQRSHSHDVDMFFYKMDAHGACIFANTAGDSCNDDGGQVIALDTNYILNHVINNTDCPVGYSWGVYPLRKIDSHTGAIIWEIPNVPTLGNVFPTYDGGFIASAQLNGAMQFTGMSTSTLLVSNSPQKNDVYILKYDSNGEIIWAKTFTNGAFLHGLKVNKDKDIVIALGDNDPVSTGTITLANAKSYIIILDSLGNYKTHTGITTPNSYIGQVDLDKYNNVYLSILSGYTLSIGSSTINFPSSTPGNIHSVVMLDQFLNYVAANFMTGYSNGPGRITVSDSAIYYILPPGSHMYVNVGTTTHTFATQNDHSTVIACMTNSFVQSVVNIFEHNILNPKVYPNPTVGKVKLSFTQPFSGAIVVINALGQTVYEHSVSNANGENIDFEELTAGVYFIHLTGENFKQRIKVIRNP